MIALDLELAKLLPARDFRVSMCSYAALFAVAVLSLGAFAFEAPGGGIAVNPLVFPDVWQNAAYVGGWVDCLLYVIALQTVTNEYQFRTARQNVIDGLSRRAFVAGKLVLMLLFALASTLLVAALALGLGGWSGGGLNGAASLSGTRFVPLHFLQVLGYLMLALLIGVIVRRTGAALLAFLGYTLLAEPLLRGLLLPPGAARYLPSAVFASLVPNPFFAYAGMRVTTASAHAVVAGALLTVVLAVASCAVFMRQDL